MTQQFVIRKVKHALLIAGAGATLSCVGVDSPGPTSEDTSDRAQALYAGVPKHSHRRVCDEAAAGEAACHARVRVDEGGITPFAATATSGLTPALLQAAYKLNVSGGAGKTIAIVDAYDNPKAESDLAFYRSTFGLPACTTANGCFKKVNQNGQTSPLPTANRGWASEISLDLQMASAVCPNCKILLVEASSASMTDLGKSVNTAAALGATVISNSYGGSESSSETSWDSTYFNHPGVGIFVSSGDDGYGTQYPAASKYVFAVGGTSLVKSTSSSRGWSETVWGSVSNANGGAGSGCSRYVAKPTWQKDTGCSKRTVADVAAVADPNTGVSVYDTYGGSGWAVYGGTSAAAPIAAGIFALTGLGGQTPQVVYDHPTAFFDVTSGANGACSTTYLCSGAPGYDGPTGIGTPNGSVLAGLSSGGGGGTGGTDGGTGGGGGSDGGTTSTCTHSKCSTGVALVSSCDPCVTSICSRDPYCCRTFWDSICVGEVRSICGLTCN